MRVEKRTIDFQNYFKQIPVSFKVYANFECNLENTEVYEGEKYHDHVPCSFAYKVVCIDGRFSKPIVAYKSENAADKLIKAILKEYKYCKKIKNKHFRNI